MKNKKLHVFSRDVLDRDGKVVWTVCKSLRDWSLLNSPEAATILEEWVCKLELKSARPHRLNRECQDPIVVCPRQ
jgi:hypothetical protein